LHLDEFPMHGFGMNNQVNRNFFFNVDDRVGDSKINGIFLGKILWQVIIFRDYKQVDITFRAWIPIRMRPKQNNFIGVSVLKLFDQLFF